MKPGATTPEGRIEAASALINLETKPHRASDRPSRSRAGLPSLIVPFLFAVSARSLAPLHPRIQTRIQARTWTHIHTRTHHAQWVYATQRMQRSTHTFAHARQAMLVRMQRNAMQRTHGRTQAVVMAAVLWLWSMRPSGTAVDLRNATAAVSNEAYDELHARVKQLEAQLSTQRDVLAMGALRRSHGSIEADRRLRPGDDAPAQDPKPWQATDWADDWRDDSQQQQPRAVDSSRQLPPGIAMPAGGSCGWRNGTAVLGLLDETMMGTARCDILSQQPSSLIASQIQQQIERAVSGNSHNRTLAASQLWMMAFNPFYKQWLIQAGAVSQLVDVVRGGGAAVQEEAAGCLWALADGSQLGSEILVATGGIDTLLRLAISGSAEARVNAAWSLRILVQMPAWRQQLVEQHGIEVLLQLLDNAPVEAQALHTHAPVLACACACACVCRRRLSRRSS